jgi:hypothetical protein
LTWSHLDGHVPTATWDVAVDPKDWNRVVATSFFDGRIKSIAGINISADGGRTWSHPAGQPATNSCLTADRYREPAAYGIAIDHDNPNNIYVGTNCGLAISRDRGTSFFWVDPTPNTLADDVWSVVVHDHGIIDLCGDDGGLRSIDGGAKWKPATGVALPSGRCSLAVSPNESYVLFAVVGTEIFESDDGGDNWNVKYVNPSPQGRIPFVATNERSTGFDLWFGDVSLYRATCTTPTPAVPGGTGRCPDSVNWAGGFTRSAGGHDDTGSILFDPRVSLDECPIMFSSDGGVFLNKVKTSPDCHTPQWIQPNVTPHALWLFTMSGAETAGVLKEDVYFGTQDNGFFGTRDGGLPRPSWNEPVCCDAFDSAADSAREINSDCCYDPGPANIFFSGRPGATDSTQIKIPGTVPGSWRPVPHLDRFGPNSYVLLTTTGVFITTNIGASPIPWTQLGSVTPPKACGIRASKGGGTAVFYLETGACDGRLPDRIFVYRGLRSDGIWLPLKPPGNVGGFGVFTVDSANSNLLMASHLGGPKPEMVSSDNGGSAWRSDTTLDRLMTGNGDFAYQNATGPTDFTGFEGYPQPSLVAIDPYNANVRVAGGVDSGVFLSLDGGKHWSLETDPVHPATSGRPLLPRPRFSYFHQAAKSVRIYIGTQGRGVWLASFSNQ